MPDNIFLPDPGSDGWSPAYLRIIRQAADKIIVNPAMAYPREQAMTECERDRADAVLAPYWEMVRKTERQRMVVKSPQSYLNEWVLWQRKVER